MNHMLIITSFTVKKVKVLLQKDKASDNVKIVFAFRSLYVSMGYKVFSNVVPFFLFYFFHGSKRNISW